MLLLSVKWRRWQPSLFGGLSDRGIYLWMERRGVCFALTCALLESDVVLAPGSYLVNTCYYE